MTRPHPRHLRTVWKPDGGANPWIVQSCYATADQAHSWQDIIRFPHPMQAARYVEEIEARDQALIEAER